MPSKEISVPTQDIQFLFNRFHRELYGQPRYERFMHGETLDQWEFLLGPDVRGFHHPRITADITDQFIHANETYGTHLPADEQQSLRIAALIHDFGEIPIDSQSVGDVSFDQKSDIHEQQEHRVFTMVVQLLPQNAVSDQLRTVYNTVVFQKETKLGRMFNAIERVGYMKTAIRAFRGVNGQRIHNWRGLTGNVLSNQTETLLSYHHEYPYVKNVLTDSMADISLMFLAVAAFPTPDDKDGSPSFSRSKFELARALWENFQQEYILSI